MAHDYVTGKTTQFGRSHTHHRGVAGGRWKKRAQKTNRTFKANLQTVTIIEGGIKKQVKLAAKTLKRVKKDIVEGKKAAVKLAYMPHNLLKAVAERKAAKASGVPMAPKVRKATRGVKGPRAPKSAAVVKAGKAAKAANKVVRTAKAINKQATKAARTAKAAKK